MVQVRHSMRGGATERGTTVSGSQGGRPTTVTAQPMFDCVLGGWRVCLTPQLRVPRDSETRSGGLHSHATRPSIHGDDDLAHGWKGEAPRWQSASHYGAGEERLAHCAP
jgi:hypothetical protein